MPELRTVAATEAPTLPALLSTLNPVLNGVRTCPQKKPSFNHHMVNFKIFFFFFSFNRQMELITKPKEGSMKGNCFHVSLLIILFICIVIHNYAITAALYLEYVTWKFIVSPGMLEYLPYPRSSLPSYG